MQLFTIVTASPNRHRSSEQASMARKRLLHKMATDAARNGERKIELHKFTDYPLDLAMTLAKFAESLQSELPTEEEHFAGYA